MRNRKQLFDFAAVESARGIDAARDGSCACAYYLIALYYHYFVSREYCVGAIQETLGRRDANALEMAKAARRRVNWGRRANRQSNSASNCIGYSEQ